MSFRRLYVFFVLRLDTREVLHANVTQNPTAAWTTQQLRNACWDGTPVRLIRDRDAKYTGTFDAIVKGAGGRILLTPPETPVANAFAERMVGTLRREVFDHVIPRDEAHARTLLQQYLRHYHGRPHQGLGQRTPDQVREKRPFPPPPGPPLRVVAQPVLNGLIHEYWLAA